MKSTISQPPSEYPPPIDEEFSLEKKITFQDVLAMIAHFRKLGRLSPSAAFKLLSQARQHLKSRPALGELRTRGDAPLTIVGNLQGQFFDLLQIFELNGFPSPQNRYVINGGLADQGWFGTEVLFTLVAIELALPGSVFFNGSTGKNNGNNFITKFFRKEIMCKYGGWDESDISTLHAVYGVLAEFSHAHVVNGSTFVVHGSVPWSPSKVYDLAFLRTLHKAPPLFDFDFLKNEVDLQHEQVKFIMLGGAESASPDVTASFLKANNLKRVIFSNRVSLADGVETSQDGFIQTVCSAPRGRSRGAIVRFDSDADSVNSEGKIIYFNNSFDPYYDTSMNLPMLMHSRGVGSL